MVTEKWWAFRLPILWLFLGPPVFRALHSRGALASLEGQVGIWNLLRLVWWLAFGILALVGIWNERKAIRTLLRESAAFVVWTALWLASLYISAFVSPAPKFTLVDASMMTILTLASLNLALKARSGAVTLTATFRSLLVFSWALLFAALAVYFIAPGQVSVDTTTFGLRVLGGFVADVPLVSVIVILLSLHLGVRARVGVRVMFVLSGAGGFALLLLSQTRTAYIDCAVGSIFLLVQYYLGARSRRRLVLIGIGSLVLSVVAVTAFLPEIRGVSGPLGEAFVYLRRDNQSWQTASGRFGIWTVLLEAVGEQPLGLGYAAGPRLVLQTSTWELWKYGVIADRIGNAHSMYVEVFAGAGYVGAFAWLGLLLWLAFRMLLVQGASMGMVRTMLVVLLLNGLTGSEGVLPFMQASVLIWITAALIISRPTHRAPPIRT